MDIEDLERLKELKKFGKIKYIAALTLYFNNFISLKFFSPGTLD